MGAFRYRFGAVHKRLREIRRARDLDWKQVCLSILVLMPPVLATLAPFLWALGYLFRSF